MLVREVMEIPKTDGVMTSASCNRIANKGCKRLHKGGRR
jgi:hypothetical protein